MDWQLPRLIIATAVAVLVAVVVLAAAGVFVLIFGRRP
jgi:hypothetical protein